MKRLYKLQSGQTSKVTDWYVHSVLYASQFLQLSCFRTEDYEYLTPRLNRYVIQATGSATGKAGGETKETVQETYARKFLSTDS